MLQRIYARTPGLSSVAALACAQVTVVTIYAFLQAFYKVSGFRTLSELTDGLSLAGPYLVVRLLVFVTQPLVCLVVVVLRLHLRSWRAWPFWLLSFLLLALELFHFEFGMIFVAYSPLLYDGNRALSELLLSPVFILIVIALNCFWTTQAAQNWFHRT